MPQSLDDFVVHDRAAIVKANTLHSSIRHQRSQFRWRVGVTTGSLFGVRVQTALYEQLHSKGQEVDAIAIVPSTVILAGVGVYCLLQAARIAVGAVRTELQYNRHIQYMTPPALEFHQEYGKAGLKREK